MVIQQRLDFFNAGTTDDVGTRVLVLLYLQHHAKPLLTHAVLHALNRELLSGGFGDFLKQGNLVWLLDHLVVDDLMQVQGFLVLADLELLGKSIPVPLLQTSVGEYTNQRQILLLQLQQLCANFVGYLQWCCMALPELTDYTGELTEGLPQTLFDLFRVEVLRELCLPLLHGGFHLCNQCPQLLVGFEVDLNFFELGESSVWPA